MAQGWAQGTGIFLSGFWGRFLCPVRYLSMNEMMVFLVAMVVRYDLVLVEGYWKPLKTGHHITISILKPKEDIEVEVRERLNGNSFKWEFLWKGAKIEDLKL
ncbi:hypothetical protein BS50DRAFT_587812 [Corynespora cassiicola Philippines]|uniref:Uncharacterized protein n=1 Tax=Corynespora cassiicola Philippines TaxID=1448308 RepID=A0A2T2NMS5_CORCC|nr:hypothetical protein BS50DRAFT_587812 [Corynespora cassiicola Philippines]